MFNRIKNKLKASMLLLFGLLLLAAPLKTLASDGPKFNFLPDDAEMFTGLNDSKGETRWHDPVAGIPGDTFSGIIYFHNGYKDTVAKNTRVKVDMPVQSVNGKVVMTSHVWADNAEAISDTVTYSFPEDVKVNFIPETVKWFQDYHDGDHSTPLLGNQTGVELMSPNGLAVGDVRGCWEYVGFVRFKFTVVKITPEIVNLKIDKTVRNITTNQTNFVKENEACAGDTLEYRIIISNSGNGGIASAILSDLIPANTAYIAGSAKIFINGVAANLPDSIIGDGAPLGAIVPGYLSEVRFLVKTSPAIAGGEVLVNTAYLRFNKETLSSQAITHIKKVVVVVPGQPGAGPGLPVTGAETWILPLLLIPGGFMLTKYLKSKNILSKLTLNK